MQSHHRFEKSALCPTNESLLAFLQAGPTQSPTEVEMRLIEHLSNCEFCELTLELLRAHPAHPDSDPPAVPPVPESLIHLFSKHCHN